MSIKCEKCETVNEVDSKFCKNCGSTLNSEPVPVMSIDEKKNLKQTIIKVGFVIVAVAAAIAIFIIQKEYSETIGLENKCENNDAHACHDLGQGHANGTKGIIFKLEYDSKKAFDYFAKACKLGYGAGCYGAGTAYMYATQDVGKSVPLEYFNRGCELQDGQSCYQVGKIYLENQTNQIDCMRHVLNGKPLEINCERQDQINNYNMNQVNNSRAYFQQACALGNELGCAEYNANR